jgi:hypothetical protein
LISGKETKSIVNFTTTEIAYGRRASLVLPALFVFRKGVSTSKRKVKFEKP